MVVRDGSDGSFTEAPRVTAIRPAAATPDRLRELSVEAGRPISSSFTAPKNGFAIHSTEPTNTYLAHPGSDVQIEVYDPSATHVRELITSGQVVPVG